MKRVEDKALQFMAALSDVYRDEEVRELSAFSKLEMSDNLTEDFTAIRNWTMTKKPKCFLRFFIRTSW